MDISRIAVVGAGAMGCLFAARIAETGREVTLVDVDRIRLDLITREGLVLEDDDGLRIVHPAAMKAAELEGRFDLVIIFTKGMHTESAVRSVRHLAGPNTLALTLQNGVGNAEKLADIFGADNVLMGTAHLPADLVAPNRVTSGGFNHIALGGYNAAGHGKAAVVAALLSESGFEPALDARVEEAIWTKLAFNAALNPLAMITQSNNGQMDSIPGRAITDDIIAEAVAVAAARGLTLDRDAIVTTARRALVGHPGHEASMLQDRNHVRSSEIETINGAVVAEGMRLGVATPVNRTMANLVRQIELNYLT